MKNYYATKKYEILSKLKEDSVNYIFISDIHYMGISTGQGAVLLEQIKQAVDLANECENIDFWFLAEIPFKAIGKIKRTALKPTEKFFRLLKNVKNPFLF